MKRITLIIPLYVPLSSRPILTPVLKTIGWFQGCENKDFQFNAGKQAAATLKIKGEGKKITLNSQENEWHPMIPEANTTEETQ